MNSYLSSVQYAQWAISILLEMCLFAVLLQRRAYRQFPAFCVYIGFLCVNSWVLMSISFYGSLKDYFFAYWICQAVASCALLCVVVEVVSDVCLPGLLCSPVQMRLLTNVCLLVVFAAAWVPQHTVTTTKFPFLNALIASEKAFGYVTAAALGCLFIFTGALGLSWTRRALGITAGIIASTALGVLVDHPLKYFPGPWRALLSQLSYAGSALSLCLWLMVFLRLDKSAEHGVGRLSTDLGEALRWAEGFQRMIGHRLMWLQYSHRR